MKQQAFAIGDHVEKYTGAYVGPGVIKGFAFFGDEIRYIVAHKIEGGNGEFLHVYSPANIRPLRTFSGAGMPQESNPRTPFELGKYYRKRGKIGSSRVVAIGSEHLTTRDGSGLNVAHHLDGTAIGVGWSAHDLLPGADEDMSPTDANIPPMFEQGNSYRTTGGFMVKIVNATDYGRLRGQQIGSDATVLYRENGEPVVAAWNDFTLIAGAIEDEQPANPNRALVTFDDLNSRMQGIQKQIDQIRREIEFVAGVPPARR